VVGLAAVSPIAQTFSQVAYAGGDVVTDQPHAFDAVDTTAGGFVRVPVLELHSRHLIDVGIVSECHDEIDVPNEVAFDGFGLSLLMSTPTSAGA
jgi:hypothetical protein